MGNAGGSEQHSTRAHQEWVRGASLLHAKGLQGRRRVLAVSCRAHWEKSQLEPVQASAHWLQASQRTPALTGSPRPSAPAGPSNKMAYQQVLGGRRGV